MEAEPWKTIKISLAVSSYPKYPATEKLRKKEEKKEKKKEKKKKKRILKTKEYVIQ